MLRLPRAARDPGWAPLRRHRPSRRRLLAAGLGAAALAAGLHVLAPEPPTGVRVLVATHEVGAGTVLSTGDLRSSVRVPGQVPDGAMHDAADAVGRTVGSGLRRGEALTDARLVGAGLLVGRPPGEVAAPVRIADGEATRLVQVGDHVDVLVAVESQATARSVVRRATVLARPAADEGGGALVGGGAESSTGGLLVLAVDEQEAGDLAQAAAQGPLSLVIR